MNIWSAAGSEEVRYLGSAVALAFSIMETAILAVDKNVFLSSAGGNGGGETMRVFLLLLILSHIEALRILGVRDRVLSGTRIHLFERFQNQGKKVSTTKVLGEAERKELWRKISEFEQNAVSLLAEGSESSSEEAYKMLIRSASLKEQDPFISLAASYAAAKNSGECEKLMTAMKVCSFITNTVHCLRLLRFNSTFTFPFTRHFQTHKTANVPPHVSGLVARQRVDTFGFSDEDATGDSSDTVTEKIRVKVNSYFDPEKV